MKKLTLKIELEMKDSYTPDQAQELLNSVVNITHDNFFGNDEDGGIYNEPGSVDWDKCDFKMELTRE